MVKLTPSASPARRRLAGLGFASSSDSVGASHLHPQSPPSQFPSLPSSSERSAQYQTGVTEPSNGENVIVIPDTVAPISEHHRLSSQIHPQKLSTGGLHPSPPFVNRITSEISGLPPIIHIQDSDCESDLDECQKDYADVDEYDEQRPSTAGGVFTAIVYRSSPDVPTDDRGNPPLIDYFPQAVQLFPETDTEGARFGNSTLNKVAVVIPVYNEDALELWHSLRDLTAQQEELANQYQLDICIILDGWSRASQSMKDYLIGLFPPLDPYSSHAIILNSIDSYCDMVVNWVVPLERGGFEFGPQLATNSEIDEQLPVTVVISRRAPDEQTRLLVSLFHPYDKQRLKSGCLLLTLILKKDNRRKHNSHIWFLSPNGFAPSTGAELYFLTEGGTMFEPGCIRTLIRYMNRNHRCGVVTGRQRVMTARQQVLPESWISFMSLYRAAIMFDYEAGFASFVGAFALFGFLPVVPGPCGLYHRRTLQGEPLERYFEILQQSPQETGLVLGNLRLAEDRVLSYAPMLWGESVGESIYMGVEPEATFLFQQEEGLENLVAQRRRWINGTVAGYLWLVSNFELILNSVRMSYTTKVFTILLSIFQLILYLEVSIAPMIFLLPLRHLLVDYLGIRLVQSTLPTSFFVEIMWWCAVVLYLVFVVRHGAFVKYDAWAFLILGILGAISLLSGMITLIVYMSSSQSPFNSITHTSATSDIILGNDTAVLFETTTSNSAAFQLVGITIILSVFIIPFINAFLFSPFSCLLMVLTVIPFWIFLPTLVCWFGAYAFSRFWDLNWGNRPSDQMDEISNAAAREQTQRLLKQESYAITAFIVFLNFVYALLLELQTARPIVIGLTILLLFFSALIQMILSFFFAVQFNIKRLIHRCCSLSVPVFSQSSSSSSSQDHSTRFPQTDAVDP